MYEALQQSQCWSWTNWHSLPPIVVVWEAPPSLSPLLLTRKLESTILGKQKVKPQHQKPFCDGFVPWLLFDYSRGAHCGKKARVLVKGNILFTYSPTSLSTKPRFNSFYIIWARTLEARTGRLRLRKNIKWQSCWRASREFLSSLLW